MNETFERPEISTAKKEVNPKKAVWGKSFRRTAMAMALMGLSGIANDQNQSSVDPLPEQGIGNRAETDPDHSANYVQTDTDYETKGSDSDYDYSPSNFSDSNYETNGSDTTKYAYEVPIDEAKVLHGVFDQIKKENIEHQEKTDNQYRVEFENAIERPVVIDQNASGRWFRPEARFAAEIDGKYYEFTQQDIDLIENTVRAISRDDSEQTFRAYKEAYGKKLHRVISDEEMNGILMPTTPEERDLCFNNPDIDETVMGIVTSARTREEEFIKQRLLSRGYQVTGKDIPTQFNKITEEEKAKEHK